MRAIWQVVKGPWVLCAGLLILCEVNVSPASANPDPFVILGQIHKGHTIPRYVALANETKSLSRAVTELCMDALSEIKAEEAKSAFHLAFDTWQAVQHIRHGPATENDRHLRIQFWPDKRGRVGKHLSKFLAGTDQSRQQFEPHEFATISVALQGFPALERLMFGDRRLINKLYSDEKGPRCSMAKAIAINLTRISSEIVQSAQSFSPKGTKDELRDHLTDLSASMQAIIRLKIRTALGTTKPRPKRSESWRSNRSLKNIAINLESLRELTILLLQEMKGEPEYDLILREYANLSMKLRMLGPDIRTTLTEPNGASTLRVLAVSIEDLHDLVVQTVSEHLEISTGFNALDGD